MPRRSFRLAIAIVSLLVSLFVRADCPADSPDISLSFEETSAGPTYLAVAHNGVDWIEVDDGGTQRYNSVNPSPLRVQIFRNCQLTTRHVTVTATKCGKVVENSIDVPVPNMQPKISLVPAPPGGFASTVRVDYDWGPNSGVNRIRATVLNNGRVPLDTTQVNGSVWTGSVDATTTAGDEGSLLIEAWACNAFKFVGVVPIGSNQDKCKCKDGKCEPLPQCTGNPVNTFSGSMLYEEADPLPSNDFLPFRRTYLSRREAAGVFGPRWYSLFDARLTTVSDIDGVEFATVFDESHADMTFMLDGSSYRQLDPGTAQRATLVHNLDGTWTQTDANGLLQRTFNAGGYPTAYRDVRSGRETRIVWDGTDPWVVKDSWGNWSWVVTVSPSTHRITRIDVAGHPELFWTYVYEDTHLTRVDSAAGTWRSYEYYRSNETYPLYRLRVIRDGAGNLIESHDYESQNGIATSSFGPNGEIGSIAVRQAGRNASEQATVIHHLNGRDETHYKRLVAGEWRTVQVDGGCSSCGQRDGTVVYDDNANPIRVQGSDGFITERTYDGPARNVLTERTALRPDDCDPAADASRCRLDPDELAAAELVETAVTTESSFEYADTHWPDRVTTSIRTGVVDTVTTVTTYDQTTGEMLTRVVTGWGRNPTHEETRGTVNTLYNGTEGAAFAPGGAFDAAWSTLAQPRLRKSTDGPRTDVADTTTFVYYPINAAVPEAWRGHLAATRNAAGHITRFEDYDVFGHATRVVDPNGAVRTSTFDALGRPLLSKSEGITGCDTTLDALCASDMTTQRTYSGAGPLASESHANGVTTYTYDSRGRVATISRGPTVSDLRERIEYTYDTATAKKSMERFLAWESGAWVEKRRESFGYDAFEQLQTQTHADTTSVAYAYDASGRVKSIRDENHVAANTTYAYDPAGRLQTVTQKLGAGTITTSYGYDVVGNLESVTDPNGNVTSYEYDDFGAMTKQISPVTGTTTYTYDKAGNVLQTTDANGATTTRVYDALGRVTSSVSARSGFDTETTMWTYDANTFGVGRLSTMTDPAGSTAYRYTHRGALARETRVMNGETYVTRYGYDLAGNRSSMTYPLGRVAQTAFDFANRPQAMTVDSNAIVTNTAYAPFGPMTLASYGNGTTRTMAIDSRNRPQTNVLTGPGGTIASYAYGYDAGGNITSLHDQLDATYNRDFAYDDLNRLITANSGTSLWGTGSYSYDAMGNMQSATLGAHATTFSYNGTTPKLVSVTADGVLRSITYDPAGNEKTVGSSSSTYSPRNSLTAYEEVQYTYDGRGVRAVTSEPAALTQLNVPSTIGGGRTVQGQVVLRRAAPAGGALVTLVSDSALATTPSSVTVAAGQTSASFDIATSTVDEATTVTISASYQGITIDAETQLMPAAVSSLAFQPSTLRGGQSSTGTVTLSAPAPAGGASVQLASNDATHWSVPASVSVAAAAESATFTASAPVAVTSAVNATVTATYRGTAQASVSVVPAAISSVVFDSSHVEGGSTMNAVVTLDGMAPGSVLSFTSSDSALRAPASVTLATQTTVSVAVRTDWVSTARTAVLTAHLGASSSSASLVLDPASITLQSFTVTPTSIVGSNVATGTVTISAAAPTGGIDIELGEFESGIVPPFVTVAAGQTQATFPIETTLVENNETRTLHARRGLTEVSATLQITTTSTPLTISIYPIGTIPWDSTERRTGGDSFRLYVQGEGNSISYDSTRPDLIEPYDDWQALADWATNYYEIDAKSVTAPADVVITGLSDGARAQQRVVIVPADGSPSIADFGFTTASVTGGTTATATVWLSDVAPTGGLTVTLSGSRSGLATVPTSVTIPAGESYATADVTTEPTYRKRGILMRAIYAGQMRTAVLSVEPTPLPAMTVPIAATSTLSPMTSAQLATQTTSVPLSRYSFYSPELNLIAETESSASATKPIRYEYLWFAGQPVAQIDTVANTTSWYFNDHLGTPMLQTNATAQVTWRAEYDPYGTVHSLRTGATQHQPLRFPGQESADDKDIAYNIFRWYRAGWGRYTQGDPVGIGGRGIELPGRGWEMWSQRRMERSRKAGFSGATAQTLYAYVDDNPSRASDPTGLYISWDCTAERTTEWSTRFPKNPQNIKDGVDFVCVYSVKCEAIEPFMNILIKGEGFWIRYMGTPRPCKCDKFCVFSFQGWPATVMGQELFVPSGPPICSDLGPGFI